MGPSSPFDVLAASEEINHFKRDYDLELTRCTWLQADCAYVCVGIVEVASSEMHTALSDQRIEHRGPKQVYIGRACSPMDEIIVEAVYDSLCQDISRAYMKECISAHSSLQWGQLCLSTARYDHSSFSTIADILTPVQKWYSSALQGERSAVVCHCHHKDHLLQSTSDPVAQLGTNSAVHLQRAAWQNTACSGNSGR